MKSVKFLLVLALILLAGTASAESFRPYSTNRYGNVVVTTVKFNSSREVNDYLQPQDTCPGMNVTFDQATDSDVTFYLIGPEDTTLAQIEAGSGTSFTGDTTTATSIDETGYQKWSVVVDTAETSGNSYMVVTCSLIAKGGGGGGGLLGVGTLAQMDASTPSGTDILWAQTDDDGSGDCNCGGDGCAAGTGYLLCMWNGTDFIPAGVSGGLSNSFSVFTLSGSGTIGTSPIADSSADSLTWYGGTGVTIIGDSGTDSMVISLAAPIQDLADGDLNGAVVGLGVDAANVNTGTLPNSVLDADLQDLADGSLSGSLVGSGINASNITSGQFSSALVPISFLDAITELSSTIRTGLDIWVVTGTEGVSGNCAEWDANGDLVDAGAPCGTGGGGGLANVVEDLTPQLGGDLDLNGNDITGSGTINLNADATLGGTFCAKEGTDDSPGGAGTEHTLCHKVPDTGLTADVLHTVNAQGKYTGSSLIADNSLSETQLSFNAGTLIASGTTVLATSAIGSGACNTANTGISASGVVSSDVISWTPNADISTVVGYQPVTTGALIIYPYPGTGTVSFKVCNPTTASITPGSAVSINWKVFR